MFASVLTAVHSISSDVLILVITLAVFFAYSIYFGRNRTVALVFAYYPAVILYQSFPFLSKLILTGHGTMFLVANKVVIFLIFFLPLTIIISRYIFIESVHVGKPNILQNVHIFRNLGLSVVCLTVALVFSYTIIDVSAIHNFGGGIDMLFSTPARIWGMNLLPLVLLAFL